MDGLRQTNNGMAAPPYTNGPYTWYQHFSTADVKGLDIRVYNSATSGDNRAMYLREYLTGAGSGGEALRAFTTISDVEGGTAHGAHISLNFGDTGELTGLGVAMRGTLHIPDDAGWTGGTLAALQAEIYSDGDASDPDGITEISFIRIVNAGNANGIADIDDDAFLFSLQGFTAGADQLLDTGTGMGTVTGTLKIKIGADTRYLPFYSTTA